MANTGFYAQKRYQGTAEILVIPVIRGRMRVSTFKRELSRRSLLTGAGIAAASGVALTATAPPAGADILNSGSLVVTDVLWAGGADPTGVQDSLAAFIAAISALTSGGTLYVPAGTYSVSGPIDLPSNGFQIKLSGAGRSATTITAHGTTTFPALVRQQAPSPWNSGGAHEISHLCLDSNRIATRNIDLANAHGVHIHNVYGINPAIGASNIRIYAPTDIAWENHIGPNVRVEGGGGTDQSKWAAYNIEVTSSDNWINDVVCKNASVANCLDSGGNNFWQGVHTFGGPIGFYSQGPFGSSFTDCEADTPDLFGFKVEASKSKIVACRVFWPSTPSDSAQGIRLVYPITDSLVTANVITDIPGFRRIASVGRVDATTLIYGNPGATLNTGIWQTAPDGFLSVQYPDGTPGLGNMRGAGSTDVQFGRSNPLQVASGRSAFSAGYGNTASGYASATFGSLNTASGAHSIATGAYSHTRGTVGKVAHALGRFAADGDQQIGRYVVAMATNSRTKTRLTIGGGAISAATTIVMPSAAAAYMVNVNLAGFRPDSGDAICWTTQAVVTRRSTAASTALVAAANWTAGQATVGASGAIPGLWADTTYGGIAVWVTPPSTNVWHWVARIETVEIG